MLNSDLEVADSIPGYTTYIYKENRFRRPEEYVGAWKEGMKTPELRKLMQTNDLDPEWDLSQVVTVVAQLNSKIAEMEDDEERINKLVQDVNDAKYETEKKVEAAKREMQVLADDRMKEITRRELITKHVLQYGTHESDCSYAEAISCGRILRGSEEKLCDCGWYAVRQELKANLK